MKKIVASVGLVAIGASALQTASAQSLGGPDTSKPWSVSATLRGFYDDNTSTLPNAAAVPAGYHRDSFGFEVSPSAAFAWSVEQTTLNLGALYSLKYYDNKPINSTDHTDQSFTFNASLDHSFNESIRARVSDSFVIGQEPDLLRAGNTFATFQRISGDNIRNYGAISLEDQFTPTLGMNVGYDNAFYDYQAKGATVDGAGDIIPSVAGVLNRMEHRAHLEGTYSLAPETKALLGYQYTEIDYNGDEPIGGNVFAALLGTPFLMSRDRDSREHTVYTGLTHNFSPQLTGAVRVGASYTDYFNDPAASSTWTPYVNANLRYTYAPESYVEGGFSYDRNATDVAFLPGSSLTLDAESAVVYASVNHRILPNLFGSIMGQFQNSTYNGGAFNNKDEQYYLAGIDLEYRFNQYFSSHVGYNYDRLESNLGRMFDRNRVYVGITASY